MALENLTPVIRPEKILNGDAIEPVTRKEYFMQKGSAGGSEAIYGYFLLRTDDGDTATVPASSIIGKAIKADLEAGLTIVEIAPKLNIFGVLSGSIMNITYSGNNAIYTMKNLLCLPVNSTPTPVYVSRQITLNPSANSILTISRPTITNVSDGTAVAYGTLTLPASANTLSLMYTSSQQVN